VTRKIASIAIEFLEDDGRRRCRDVRCVEVEDHVGTPALLDRREQVRCGDRPVEGVEYGLPRPLVYERRFERVLPSCLEALVRDRIDNVRVQVGGNA